MTNPLQFAPVPRRDREATERRVVRAALEILERNSALYGFRLRDVAEHPEISRGNFFCYFGNRRELLRRTLHVRFTEMAEPKETQPSEPLDNHSLT
ncbi:TetR/AcrR family transcriptional regulator [Acidimicrobiales bacterium]|nr:TetR/AcrR family transcriptional regulator [Acidimicrobiales bacterium]MDC1390410.1 TetR/AcrR family transcriptional regulator [Acidimicrobiales bacterium]